MQEERDKWGKQNLKIWEILRLSILQKEKVCSGSNTKDVAVKLFAEEFMGGAEGQLERFQIGKRIWHATDDLKMQGLAKLPLGSESDLWPIFNKNMGTPSHSHKEVDSAKNKLERRFFPRISR